MDPRLRPLIQIMQTSRANMTSCNVHVRILMTKECLLNYFFRGSSWEKKLWIEGSLNNSFLENCIAVMTYKLNLLHIKFEKLIINNDMESQCWKEKITVRLKLNWNQFVNAWDFYSNLNVRKKLFISVLKNYNRFHKRT